MKTKPRELSSELFGQIFYFLANPEAIRGQLVGLTVDLLDRLRAKFTRLSEDGERTVILQCDAGDYVAERLRDHDYQTSLFLRMTDGSKDVMHSTRVEIVVSEHRPGFAKHLPSYLYIEMETEVDVEFRWALFQQIWYSGFFHLALGNRVASPHLEQMPRSGSEAARVIRSSAIALKGFYEAWGNPDYLARICSGTEIVEGPNEFMAFGPQLAKEVAVGDTLKAAGFEGSNFTFVPGDDFAFFRARSSEQLRRLAHHLTMFYCEFDKPLMFWKPGEWMEWRRKVVRGELEL